MPTKDAATAEVGIVNEEGDNEWERVGHGLLATDDPAVGSGGGGGLLHEGGVEDATVLNLDGIAEGPGLQDMDENPF